jgi:AraC-like DNA-binding protein
LSALSSLDDPLALHLEHALMAQSSESALFIRPDTLPGVEALHATFVDHRYAPHIHEELTIACVDRGAATFELEDRRHVAPAGTVFLIPPQAVHTGESATEAGYTYRVLYLEPEQLAARSGRASLPYRWRSARTVFRHRDLNAALDRIHEAVSSPGAALEQGERLAAVSRLLDDVLRSQQQPFSPLKHPAVREAREYIHEHWRSDFSLDELARAVALSPFYLARSFRSQVGMAPSAYRRALRVEAAKKLLQSGEPPVRVAASCGFYDQAHLNRHFKRVTGVTPVQYASASPYSQRGRRDDR